MAHKKHLLGRILGGAAKVILGVGGAALGLGAVGGLIKGTGALTGIKNLFTKFSGAGKKVRDGATKLLTGENKEERALVLAQRSKVKEDTHALSIVQKLVNEGMDPAEARAKMGLAPEEVPFIPDSTAGDDSGEGAPADKPTITDHLKNPVVLAGIGALALLLLIRKKR